IGVGAEEARHFTLVADRLEALDSHYGALVAHDGLWQAATATAHDLLARLAVVPLVLEARGLDVTPAMIDRLTRAGDSASAAILAVILHDEIGHVATGARWFRALCVESRLEPAVAFRNAVGAHFIGRVKPPFNDSAREQAGLTPDLYLQVELQPS
ncbi:MAG: ferritin-like domain-containing protein, partial [Polymorphobacter sp.]